MVTVVEHLRLDEPWRRLRSGSAGRRPGARDEDERDEPGGADDRPCPEAAHGPAEDGQVDHEQDRQCEQGRPELPQSVVLYFVMTDDAQGRWRRHPRLRDGHPGLAGG